MNALMNFLVMLLRLALAGVFGFAAVLKLRDPQAFMLNVYSFDLVPAHVAEFAGFFLPWVEILCAVMLVIGWRTRAAALVLWTVLLAFIGAILSVLLRGMEIECGCFGKFSLMCDSDLLSWCNVLQNCLLAAVAVVVLFWGPGYLSVDEPTGRPLREAEPDED